MKKKLTISKRTSRHIKTTKTSSKHINVYNKLKLLEKAGKIKDINIIKKLLLNKIKDIDIITYNRVLDEESELHKFLTKYVKTEWSKSRSDEKRKDLKLHRFYNFVIKKISDRTIKDNTNNKVTKIALVSNLNILLTQIINSGAIKLKDAKTIKIINQLLTDKDFLIYGDSSAIKYFGKKEGDNYMKYAKINELTMNTFDITEYDTPVMIESIGKHMFILKNTDYDYSRGNYTLVEIKDCLNEYTGDSELIKELKRILDEQFKIYPQQQPSLPKPKKHPDEQVPSTESDTCSNNDCFIFYEADIDLVSMKKTYSEFKKNLSSGTYKFLSPPSQPPRRSIVYIDNTDEMRTVDTSPLKAITRGEILTRMTSDELNEDQSITTRAPTSPPPAPSISDESVVDDITSRAPTSTPPAPSISDESVVDYSTSRAPTSTPPVQSKSASGGGVNNKVPLKSLDEISNVTISSDGYELVGSERITNNIDTISLINFDALEETNIKYYYFEYKTNGKIYNICYIKKHNNGELIGFYNKETYKINYTRDKNNSIIKEAQRKIDLGDVSINRSNSTRILYKRDITNNTIYYIQKQFKYLIGKIDNIDNLIKFN